MRALVLAAAMTIAATAADAAVIANLGVNPNSGQGIFNHAPGAGLFADQYTFQLVGGPQFVTIASATNTFAGGAPDFIANFTGSIFQIVGAIGGGDDVLVLGPQAAGPCVEAPTVCQRLAGQALLSPGNYYLEFAGTAGSTAGYGGNMSTFAVPAPVLGGGLPALIALATFLGLRRRRALA